MKIYTKESLTSALKEIRNQGWIANARSGNVGGIGNTLEDLLGIEENNLPIPNAAEWELKCQRKNTSSLTTLFHMEPSPRALRFIPQVFLPKYGWPHQEAGTKYPETEMSFRQTIHGLSRSDRGFKVITDRKNKKILISFEAKAVDARHDFWLQSVKKKSGLEELNPQPYWGFDDLFHKAGTKLLNCFYLQAETKKIQGKTHFLYRDIMILQGFSVERFVEALEEGQLLIDFDARTGHNHGTKFRLRQNALPTLYSKVTNI
ncbi:MAG: MvaI/BcnI family restriction endonuclease [candidate division Zixibacteria bacterium]|nr:MvaI/BcnI family restriction endonuclease [candidate division Zixibacteria bacterium]